MSDWPKPKEHPMQAELRAAKWENKNGIATFGSYEVRVTRRLSNARPVRWAVFAAGSKEPPTNDYASFSEAKRAAEAAERLGTR